MKKVETVATNSYQPPSISVFSAPAGRSYSSKPSRDHCRRPNLQPVDISQKK